MKPCSRSGTDDALRYWRGRSETFHSQGYAPCRFKSSSLHSGGYFQNHILKITLLLTILTATLASVCPSKVWADSVVEQWESRHDGAAHDLARAVAADGTGNVIVAGSSRGTTTGDDFYTAKYDATTGALLWEKLHNGPGNGFDTAVAVAVDGAGNAIVTGSSIGIGGYADYYTVKYAAADGALLWERRYNGPANADDYPSGLVLDRVGNVIVTGSSVSTSYDYYTVKYAAENGTVVWEKRSTSPGAFSDYATAMALDSTDNVIVTGASAGVNVGTDYYTVKYASANGAVLWERRFNGPDNTEEWPRAIAVDSAGNAIVTGYTYSANVIDVLTLKYAATTGALLWEKRYDSPAHHADDGKAVKVDSRGDVIVTASSFNQLSSYDYYTAKYAAADGTLLWEKRYDGPSSTADEPSALAVDLAGNPIVTGYSSRYGTLEDYYTAKYASATGALLWERRYSPPAHSTDKATAIALDRFGNAIVTGYSYNNSPSQSDIATLKYAVGPNLDMDNDGLLDSWEIAHYGGTGAHGALDDNDHDGRVELNELAFGSDPTVPDGNGALEIAQSGIFLTVTIAKQPGVSYLVQTASTPKGSDFSSKTTEILMDTATLLKVRDRFLYEDEEDVPQRFLRVKVTAAP
jgi:hypothetical protein